MTRLLSLCFLFFLSLSSTVFAQPRNIPPELIVLGYHEITDANQALIDQYAITPQLFEQHIQWLNSHGFHFVSMDDVVAANAGQKALPANAVLLSVDDGYASFYKNAYPIIQKYNIPTVLAVVGSWLEPEYNAPVNFGEKTIARDQLLSWDQLKEMSDNGLVEIASHTYNLHTGVLANPQGNMQPALTARLYDAATNRYESDNHYSARLYQDFKANNDLFIRHGLTRPRIMVWPYGRYNTKAQEIAKQLGMPISFTLDDGTNLATTPLSALRRILVERHMSPSELEQEIYIRQRQLNDNNRAQKIMHVDLDYIYDPNPEQQERNLSQLLDRIVAMQVNTVYLQAFSDPDGNGSANMVYFPNRHLPMRADLFNRVAWQINTRTQVNRIYAWMPLLAWELPDTDPAAQDIVITAPHENNSGSPMGYHRLSPFSALARQTIHDIFQDLAKTVPFQGILFHDDMTLSDYEDASPAAKAQYAAWGLPTDLSIIRQDDALLQKWTALKTQTLDEFALAVAAEVRKQQPGLLTARNLYAQVALQAYAENWYAQSLEDSLRQYDFTAIMAMPYMEQAKDPEQFYTDLVTRVKRYPNGLKKTVFELQAKDWRTAQPIASEELADTIIKLYMRGVRHVAYYPDDAPANHPNAALLRRVFDSKSSEAIP